MNQGAILGRVRRNSRGVAGAVIGLDHIRTGEGVIPIYSTDADSTRDRLRGLRRGTFDMPTPLTNLHTVTEDNGSFVLAFQWDETDARAHDCFFQLFVLEEERSADRITMRLRGRYRNRMVPVVSLRQIANGLIPDPTSGFDVLGMGVDVYTIIREIRRPQIFLTMPGPSGGYYAIFGAIDITLP